MVHRYPALTFVFFSYIAAIGLALFLGPLFFRELVTPFGIAGIFVAGMLYTYSFTAGFAAIVLAPFVAEHSIIFIAVVGGVGAAFGDVTIFRLVRSSLHGEIKRLSNLSLVKPVLRMRFFRNTWVRNFLGFLILASPFPDEFGIAIMATTHLKEENFAMISFLANMVGIYLLVETLTLLMR